MGVQQVRTKIEPFIDYLRARARLRVWNVLGALQPPPQSFNSSFLLWQSPAEVSHVKATSPLKAYLCRLQQKTIIEPRTLFVIAARGLLIETSVSNAYASRDSSLKRYLYLPSPFEYFKARLLRRYRTDLKEVVALGTAWPFNYFHFYRDFLPKILLLEEAHIDSALPVIVPDELFDQPFFQEAIQSERLSRWRFVSPRGRFIKSKNVVFCSSQQFFRMDRSQTPEEELLARCSEGVTFLERPADVLALLGLDEGVPSGTAERRIFLTRGSGRGRTLSNYEEIEPLLRERGFETIDSEGLTLREQAQLFRECRYLIGIHGAGLTNIIYAHRHQLSVLQLRQPGEETLLTDFALMCHSYGFDHRELFGLANQRRLRSWLGRTGRNEPFRIDPDSLRLAVDQLLLASPLL